jgi:GcrA cell cycle regulator
LIGRVKTERKPCLGFLEQDDDQEATVMAWTDERVELLKKLWSEGLSARQIADQLGGVTRNAVIGKVHRLGLSGRATTTTAKTVRPRKKRAPEAVRAKTAAAPKVQAASGKSHFTPPRDNVVRREAGFGAANEALLNLADELEIPLDERVTMETLKEGQCKWPIGDPMSDDFHFCGRHQHGDSVYCEFHTAKAYQPARRNQKKKDKEQRQKLVSFR